MKNTPQRPEPAGSCGGVGSLQSFLVLGKVTFGDHDWRRAKGQPPVSKLPPTGRSWAHRPPHLVPECGHSHGEQPVLGPQGGRTAADKTSGSGGQVVSCSAESSTCRPCTRPPAGRLQPPSFSRCSILPRAGGTPRKEGSGLPKDNSTPRISLWVFQ